MCMCMCGCGCVFLICCRWDTRGVSFSFPSYFHDHTAVVCLGWEHWQRKDGAGQEWSVTSSQNSTLSGKPVVLRVVGGEGKRKFVRCRHSCTGLCVRNVSLFSLWFSVHEYSVVPILCILFCSFVRLFFFFFFGVCSSRPILFSNFDFPVNLISRADL